MSAVKRSADPRRSGSSRGAGARGATHRDAGLRGGGAGHASVIVDKRGVVTHRIVPVEEYEALVALQKAAGPSEGLIREAAAVFTSKRTKWVKAQDVLPELIENGIAAMRKRQGVTQAELGERLGVPQSRVSRMEKNADALTLRVLKRVARALGGGK